jgi:hypothetical protein
MRYFNITQSQLPKGINFNARTVPIESLEGFTEITEEQAHRKPNWGSGNLAVNEETGDFVFLNNDWDSSG